MSWGNWSSKKATVCSVCSKEAKRLHENGIYSEMHGLMWRTNIWIPRGGGCVGRLGLTLLHYVCISRSIMSDSYDPMDCSLPGSSVHGMLQVRILEWIAILYSKRSSQLMDWTQVSHTARRFFTI